MRLGRRFVIAVPNIWLILFFMVPFLVVLKISLPNRALPFHPIRHCGNG